MNGYVSNIEQLTLENDNFRKVLYTTKKSQLVLMALKPGEEIGAEVHELDQFLRVESGTGKAIVGDKEYDIADGSAIVVPEGANHNVINTGSEPMKLYTIYTPPEHKDQTIHVTKEEAMAAEEHFDGVTTD